MGNIVGRVLIIPKGVYNESQDYTMLDLVMHNGVTWLAKKDSIGIEPSEENSEYWQDVFDANVLLKEINDLKQRILNLEEKEEISVQS